MPRKARPLNRDTGVVRDASLLVIASEDTYAVRRYFDQFRPKRVQFIVLETQGGRSSPADITSRLDQYRDEFQVGDEDQLWYCGDLDHWAQSNHIANLIQVFQHCKKSHYHVCISNPCFELWLLLHFSDNVPVGDCHAVMTALRVAAGGYSKANGCSSAIDAAAVSRAITRATELDLNTEEIPRTATTRVYRILNLLIERESIVLR